MFQVIAYLVGHHNRAIVFRFTRRGAKVRQRNHPVGLAELAAGKIAHVVPWPPHCIAGTAGAEFADGLALPPSANIISKASTPDADAYSAFGGTDLALQLRHQGVRRLVVGGLATDYCVLNTVLDARAAGFEVLVLTDAVRAVEVRPGTWIEMTSALESNSASSTKKALPSCSDLTVPGK